MADNKKTSDETAGAALVGTEEFRGALGGANFKWTPAQFLSYFVLESTFTPVLAFGGASVGITYGTQTGRYTKIGSLVLLEIEITLTSKGSSTGNATITGLPFTAGSNGGLKPFSTVSIDHNVAGGFYYPLFFIASGSAVATILEGGDNVDDINLTDADFGNTSAFKLLGQYRV